MHKVRLCRSQEQFEDIEWRWKLHQAQEMARLFRPSLALHTMMHEIVSRRHELISHQPGPATWSRALDICFNFQDSHPRPGVSVAVISIRNLYGGVERGGVEWSGRSLGWMVHGWYPVQLLRTEYYDIDDNYARKTMGCGRNKKSWMAMSIVFFCSDYRLVICDLTSMALLASIPTNTHTVHHLFKCRNSFDYDFMLIMTEVTEVMELNLSIYASQPASLASQTYVNDPWLGISQILN